MEGCFMNGTKDFRGRLCPTIRFTQPPGYSYLYEIELPRPGNRLGAAMDSKFLQGAVDIIFHCAPGKDKLFSYLPVRAACDEKTQDVEFPGGEGLW